MANKSAKSAKWQFVTNHLISLPFIAQHVIDKKLVLSLTWLSFPLVRFRLNPISWGKCSFLSCDQIV